MGISKDHVQDILASHLLTEAAFADTIEEIQTKPLNADLGIDRFGLGNAITFSLLQISETDGVSLDPDDMDDIGLDLERYFPRKPLLKQVLGYFLPDAPSDIHKDTPELWLTDVTNAIWDIVPSDGRVQDKQP